MKTYVFQIFSCNSCVRTLSLLYLELSVEWTLHAFICGISISLLPHPISAFQNSIYYASTLCPTSLWTFLLCILRVGHASITKYFIAKDSCVIPWNGSQEMLNNWGLLPISFVVIPKGHLSPELNHSPHLLHHTCILYLFCISFFSDTIHIEGRKVSIIFPQSLSHH